MTPCPRAQGTLWALESTSLQPASLTARPLLPPFPFRGSWTLRGCSQASPTVGILMRAQIVYQALESDVELLSHLLILERSRPYPSAKIFREKSSHPFPGVSLG